MSGGWGGIFAGKGNTKTTRVSFERRPLLFCFWLPPPYPSILSLSLPSFFALSLPLPRARVRRNFFKHIDINPGSVNLLDGMAPDLQAECDRYERKIKELGGIELFLGGIGPDGHIAFNEPGSSITSRTGVRRSLRWFWHFQLLPVKRRRRHPPRRGCIRGIPSGIGHA